MKKLFSILTILSLACGLLVPTPITLAHDDTPNPGVIPPSATPYGMSYGDWSAKWWQWVLSIPADTNPLLDETGTQCGNGQSGKVWFLAGTFNASGTVTRSCTVPIGKGLFFPLVNAVDIHIPNDGLDTPELLRQDLLAAFGPITDLHASVDGVPVSNLDPQTTPFRACAGGAPTCAPAFSVTLPDNNLFGVPAGVYAPAVADGVYLMLAPLPPGRHTIEFGGKVVFAGSEFIQEITYHITVTPEHT